MDVASALLRGHASPMDVLAFKAYEWKLNDEEMRDAERQVSLRRDVFLPAVLKSLRAREWQKDYELAFAGLDAAEKEFWEEPTGEKVRNAWVKVVSLIWYALDVDRGGDFSRSEIAARYDTYPSTVTRYLNKVAERVEFDEAPKREERRKVEMPLSLDYDSEVARNYYTVDEIKYYSRALERYRQNEGEFDLTNPIIADIIHQIILNSYAIQRVNRELATEKKSNPTLIKRLTDLQESNAKSTRELIGLQKELGKLERNEESLGALKRRYVEVKEQRDQEKEIELEAELFARSLKNSAYLGFRN